MQYSSQFKVRLFTSGRHHIQYCRPADVSQFYSSIHEQPEYRLVLCREFLPADKTSWCHQDGNTPRRQFNMLRCLRFFAGEVFDEKILCQIKDNIIQRWRNPQNFQLLHSWY